MRGACYSVTADCFSACPVRGHGATDTAVHWLATGYTLAFALLLISGGRLGDVLGYKRLFAVGVAGFLASSLQ